jgi:CubicO group peptidase (beta-lactamase class C family)
MTTTPKTKQKQDLETTLDSYFTRYSNATPGCAVGVAVEGLPLVAKGYGLRNLITREPITPRTHFELASLSKQITAAAIHLLVADEKIKLEDDIHTYFPELPPYETVITLRHLLTHTSGLAEFNGDGLLLPELSYQDKVYSEDVLAFLAQQPPKHPAGSVFEYSNTGYFLLGEVVRRVTDVDFATFLDEQVFKPLGIEEAKVRDHTYEGYASVPELALGYEETEQGYTPAVIYENRITGSTGMFMSVLELLRWANNFRTKHVGGELLFRAMLDIHTPNTEFPSPGTTSTYGGGIFIDQSPAGSLVISHSGGEEGYTSWLGIQLEPSFLALGVLCNINGELDTQYHTGDDGYLHLFSTLRYNTSL